MNNNWYPNYGCSHFPYENGDNSVPKGHKLASDHWNYIEGILKAHDLDDKYIKTIEYHYKTAFIHGYKHAMEDFDK